MRHIVDGCGNWAGFMFVCPGEKSIKHDHNQMHLCECLLDRACLALRRGERIFFPSLLILFRRVRLRFVGKRVLPSSGHASRCNRVAQ